jgi:triacylglycerol lipase
VAKLICLFLLLTVLCNGALASGKLERDVVYCDEFSKSCLGDIYEHPESPSLPAVVVVHGGSWVMGAKDAADVLPVIEYLSGRGFVVFSIDYRLLADGGTFPNNIIDVKRAIAFLEKNAAKYGVAPDRIGVVGVSAGAHLALMAAYWPLVPDQDDVRSHIKACAAICPATDLTKWADALAPHFPSNTKSGKNAELREASPISYPHQSVPTLLEHGTADTVVPYSQSERLAKALKKVGSPVTLITLPNAQHDFILKEGENRDQALRELAAFFEQTLKGSSESTSNGGIDQP